MERNIGYAVITTEEYKEMIEDIINKKECIKELNRVDGEEKEIYKKLEQYFWNQLIKNESYHLENMKQCNPLDYHYQQLYNCFLEIGIDNVTYIHLSISSLKHNFNNKENKEEDTKE